MVNISISLNFSCYIAQQTFLFTQVFGYLRQIQLWHFINALFVAGLTLWLICMTDFNALYVKYTSHLSNTSTVTLIVFLIFGWVFSKSFIISYRYIYSLVVKVSSKQGKLKRNENKDNKTIVIMCYIRIQ